MTSVRRAQALIGNVIVAQLLPEAAVKGGTGIKLRLGDVVTRETPDLDAAFRGNREQFAEEFTACLENGWAGFAGTLTVEESRAPEALQERIGAAYVMQPMTVKLFYLGKPWQTIDLELGFDELEATTKDDAEYEMSDEVLSVFAALGLPAPAPVRVLPLHHQISQKLHACTEPGSRRAHDLVDLQLVAPLADDVKVLNACERLFRFRNTHSWPPAVIPGPSWSTIYAEAAEGLGLLSFDDAVVWVNEYIKSLSGVPGRNRRT